MLHNAPEMTDTSCAENELERISDVWKGVLECVSWISFATRADDFYS
jgi:hypothetical protein